MKNLLRIFLLAIAILFSVSIWYWQSLGAVDSGDKVRTIVDVPPGMSVSYIGDLLEQKGLIHSSRAFSLYARFHSLQTQLKAGSFVLQRSMDIPEVMDVLTVGHSDEATVTIPEGSTVAEIDAKLAEKGIITAGDLIACAKTCDFSTFDFLPPANTLKDAPGGRVEGYLFPDTYFIVKAEFVPKFFLERLLNTFRKRVVEGLATDLKSSKHSLQEIVTMASLVEGESNKDAERPVVAGILWKRLSIGMMLGVDAAVRYALNKPTGSLTKNDLDVDSLYNLRKSKGLPPGPITNPGLESIKAALHPTDSQYLYYLHDRHGLIHYAVTNDEHNANRALYLR